MRPLVFGAFLERSLNNLCRAVPAESEETMRAIVVSEHGGPEVLRIQELADPVADQGDVLIRVKAFGLNHADTYMRSGIWPFGIPVLGIEAAGTVEEDPSGRLERSRSRPRSAGQNWRRSPRCTPLRGPRSRPTWRYRAASRC